MLKAQPGPSDDSVITINDDTGTPWPPAKMNMEIPTGMWNVGSSCWYNSVIQVFYHLPALRRQVLSSEYQGVKISKEFDAIRNTFTLLKVGLVIFKKK